MEQQQESPFRESRYAFSARHQGDRREGSRPGLRGRLAEAMLRAIVAVSPNSEQALRVATGFISQSLSTARFYCGLDPVDYYRDYFAWRPAFRSLRQGLTIEIDAQRRGARAAVFGRAGQSAHYRELLGSVTVRAPAPPAPALPATGRPAPRATGALVTGNAEPDHPLAAILARAVRPPAPGRRAATKALVVVRDGRLIGEAYAPGYGSATPIIGYSLAKTLANAVAGRMAHRALLAPDERELFAEWRGAGDARRQISIGHLLQMTSGLDIAETHSGYDPVSRMLFLSADMGGFAARAELGGVPGRRFSYTSGNTMLFARLVRDRLGTGAQGVWSFLDGELFAPLGMERMLVEFDLSGSPILSTFCYASARDWARLGLLYLDDGCVAGARLLPEGWVGYSTTGGAEPSYGAGLRLSRRGGQGEKWLLPGLPPGTFYAHGHLGQYVVVIPERRMVIVRLGTSSAAMRRHDRALLAEIAAAAAC